MLVEQKEYGTHCDERPYGNELGSSHTSLTVIDHEMVEALLVEGRAHACEDQDELGHAYLDNQNGGEKEEIDALRELGVCSEVSHVEGKCDESHFARVVENRLDAKLDRAGRHFYLARFVHQMVKGARETKSIGDFAANVAHDVGSLGLDEGALYRWRCHIRGRIRG